jgi:hypothetical protein
MTIRYAGTYNGPSYFSWEAEFEGFTSLAEAKNALHERVNGSGAFPYEVKTLTEDNFGHVTVTRIEQCLFPATTNEDFIDLYVVGGNGYRASEPYIRLTVGPRGGIIAEKF